MPLGFDVFRGINRPNPQLIEKFRSIPTADLADVMQKRGGMDPLIRTLYAPLDRVVGPAVTVSVPDGAFEVIKIALEMSQAGDVVVINAHGDTKHALLGGNVCRGLKARGLAGMVVDGAVRDLTEIREDGFPVFARGLALFMGPIVGAGEVNVPIACGNVVVNPGDIIVADEDGIVVVPPHEAASVLEAAHALHERHQAAQPVLLSGKITGIDGILERAVERGAAFHDDAYTISSHGRNQGK